MKAPPRIPEPSFALFYEGCARNSLRVCLDIITTPDGPRREPYLPAAPIYDPFSTKHDPNARAVGEQRKLEFVVRVFDGAVPCCSGDLGDSIKSPVAIENLLRMSGVLVNQSRARLRDFPYLRP